MNIHLQRVFFPSVYSIYYEKRSNETKSANKISRIIACEKIICFDNQGKG